MDKELITLNHLKEAIERVKTFIDKNKWTETVGSGTEPIYLLNGTPTKSSESVGSESKPVYMDNGKITECANSILTATYTSSTRTIKFS